MTLFPPMVLALLDPEIFFKALDFAGTYGGNLSLHINMLYIMSSKICLWFFLRFVLSYEKLLILDSSMDPDQF